MYAECLEHVLQFVGVHDEENGISSVELSEFMRHDLLPYVGLADNSIVQTTIARLLFSEYKDKLRVFVRVNRWQDTSNKKNCNNNKTISNEPQNEKARKNNKNNDKTKAFSFNSRTLTSSSRKANTSKSRQNSKKEQQHHAKHVQHTKKSTNKRMLIHECKECDTNKNKNEYEQEQNILACHSPTLTNEQKCESKVELSSAQVIEYIDCNRVEWSTHDLYNTRETKDGIHKNSEKLSNREHTSMSERLPSHSENLDTTVKHILYICSTRMLRETVLGLPLQTLRAQAVTDCITYYAIDGLEQSNGGRLAPCFQSKAHLIWLGMRWLRSRQAISSYYLLEREKDVMGKVMYNVSCRTFPVYAAPLTEEEKNESKDTISSMQRGQVQSETPVLENKNRITTSDSNSESCANYWDGAITQEFYSIQRQRQRSENPLIHYFTRKRNETHRRFPSIVLDSNLMKYIVMQSPNRKLILEDAVHAFMVAHHIQHARWENFNKANHLRLRKMIAAIGLRIVSASVYVRAHCRRQVRLVLPAEDLISFVDRRWLTSDLHRNENNMKRVENTYSISNSVVDSDNNESGKKEKLELVKLESHEVDRVFSDYKSEEQRLTLKDSTGEELSTKTSKASYGSNNSSYLSMEMQHENNTEDGIYDETVLANKGDDRQNDDEYDATNENEYEDEDLDDEEEGREIKRKRQNEPATVLTTLTQRRAEVATQHFYFVPHLPIDWQVAREAECRPVALHSVYAQLTNCGSEKARHKALGAFMESYLKTRSSAIETYYVLAKNSKSFTLVYAPKSWSDAYVLERDSLFTNAHVTQNKTAWSNDTCKAECYEQEKEEQQQYDENNNYQEEDVTHENSVNQTFLNEPLTKTQNSSNLESTDKQVPWECEESNTSEIDVNADKVKVVTSKEENTIASLCSLHELHINEEKWQEEEELEELREPSKLQEQNSISTAEVPDKDTNESELRSARFRPDDITIPRGTSAYSLNLVLEALEQAPLQALTMQQLGSIVDVTVLTRRLLPYLRACGRITTTGITPAPGRRRVGLVFLTKGSTETTSQHNITNSDNTVHETENNNKEQQYENSNVFKVKEELEEMTVSQETQTVTPAIDENVKLSVLLEAERQKQEGVFKYGTRPLSRVPFQSVESHLVLTSLPATMAGVEPSLQTQRLLSVRTQAKSTADRLMALRNGYGWHSLLRAGRLHMELWRQWYAHNHEISNITTIDNNNECRPSPSHYEENLFNLNAQFVYDNLTLSSFCVVCGFSTSDLAEFVELSSVSINSKDNYNNNGNNMSRSPQGNSYMLYHKWGTRLCDLPESMFMSCRQRGLQPFLHALNILQTRKLITCVENIDAFTSTPLHELSFRLSSQIAHTHQNSVYYTLYDTENTLFNSPGGTAYVLLRYWLPVWSSIDQHGIIPHLSSVIKQERNLSFPRLLALSKILRVRLHHCAVALYQRAGYTLRLPRPKSTRNTIWGKMTKSVRYKHRHRHNHHRTNKDSVSSLEREKRKRRRQRERERQEGTRNSEENDDDLDLEQSDQNEEEEEEEMGKYSLFEKHYSSNRAREHLRRDHRVNITGTTVAAALQEVFANTPPTQWLHRMWEVIKLLERNRRVMLSSCVAHTTPHYNILDTIRGSSECHAMLGNSQLSFARSCTLSNIENSNNNEGIDDITHNNNTTMDICIPTFIVEACVKLYNHDSYGNMIGLEYISQPTLNSSVIHLALLATTMRRLTYQCIPSSLTYVDDSTSQNDNHTITSTSINNSNVNNATEKTNKEVKPTKSEERVTREEQLKQCVQNAFSPSPFVTWEKENVTVGELRKQRMTYLQSCTFSSNNKETSSTSPHPVESISSNPKHMERYNAEMLQWEAAFDLALDTLRMMVLSDTSHYHAQTAKTLLLTFPPGVVAKARNYLRTLPSFRKGRQRDRVPDLSLISKPWLFSTSYVHNVHRSCANARVMQSMCNYLQAESQIASCNSLLWSSSSSSSSSLLELANGNTSPCCANWLANKSTELFVVHDKLSLRLQPSIDYSSVTSEHGLTEEVIASLQLPLFAWSSPSTRDEAQHELFSVEVKQCRRTRESKRTRSDEYYEEEEEFDEKKSEQLSNTQTNNSAKNDSEMEEKEKSCSNSVKKVKYENTPHSPSSSTQNEELEQKLETKEENSELKTQKEERINMTNYSAVSVHEDEVHVAETVRALYPARSLCGNEEIKWLEEIAIDAEPSELELAALQKCLYCFSHNDFVSIYTNSALNKSSNNCKVDTEAALQEESSAECTAIHQLLNEQAPPPSSRIAYPSIFHHVDGAFHHYVWKYFLVHLYRYLLHVPGITHRALLGVMTSSGLVSERACEAGLAALIDSGLVTRSKMHMGNAPLCVSTLSHKSPLQRNNVICTSPFQRKRWREENDSTTNEHHLHHKGNTLINSKESTSSKQEVHSLQRSTTLWSVKCESECCYHAVASHYGLSDIAQL